MRVLYHSDAFVSEGQYGLARYARELHQAIGEANLGCELIPFSSRAKRKSSAARHLVGQRYVHPGWHHRALVMNWMTLGLPRIERWVPRAEVVHTVELDYPVATRLPWIVTIHDLGPLTHPHFFSRSRRWVREMGLKAAVRYADRIVAVSSATANAVESRAGTFLGSRLHVIPEGVGANFLTQADPLVPPPQTEGLPPRDVPYFLWAGSMNPRKNLGTVLRSFERIAERIPHHLVLVGGLAWDHGSVLNQIGRSSVRDRIHRPGFVSDECLRHLYRHATAFVYVSLLEGFGLPILEAMASGCPVITSNVSSMPEVAGSAAALVDPLSISQVAEQMEYLAHDDGAAQTYRTLGRARAERYRWSAVAEAVVGVYGRYAARLEWMPA
jgi:glycosyltransferase involved in cell wall biosynthesis